MSQFFYNFFYTTFHEIQFYVFQISKLSSQGSKFLIAYNIRSSLCHFYQIKESSIYIRIYKAEHPFLIKFYIFLGISLKLIIIHQQHASTKVSTSKAFKVLQSCKKFMCLMTSHTPQKKSRPQLACSELSCFCFSAHIIA